MTEAPPPKPRFIDRGLPRASVLVFGMLLVWTTGLLVRLRPETSPSFRYETDSAYHLRMIEAVARTGSFPPADPKYVREPPRDNRRMCPAAFHQLAAAGHAITGRLAPVSLPDFLGGFGPALGAMAVLPLLAMAWWLTRRWPETVLAGLLFAVATPVVMRSGFQIVRYEALGITLVLSLAAILVRWRAGGLRPGLSATLLAVCFGLGLLGAGTWRLFPSLAGLLVLGLTVAEVLRPWSRRAGLAPAAAAAAGCLAAGVTWDYYLLGGAPAWWGLLALPATVLVYVLVLWHPVRRRLDACPRRTRIAWLLMSATAMAAAGFALPAGRLWLLPSLGLASGPGTGGAIPVLVSEMLPVPAGKIFSWDFFAYFPVLYLAVLALAAWLGRSRGADPFPGLLALGGGLLALTFNRLGYFGLPLVIAHFACLVSRLGDCRFPWPRQPASRQPLLRYKARILCLLALLPLLAGFTIRSRANLAALARPPEDAAAAYGYLAEQGGSRLVVAASWSRGYELQFYTPAATITDGFLESEDNRRRIAAFTDALFAPDEGLALRAYCWRYGARYLLLDSAHLLPLCRRLGKPWQEWLRVSHTNGGSRVEVLPEGRRIAWIRLLANPGEAAPFRLRFARGNLLIFEVSHDSE